jgi:hypothetical protein
LTRKKIMVSRSDPTHEDAGEEGGRPDIQRIHIKGGDYVLVPEEKYQQLLDELDSLDTSLAIQRARTAEASGHPLSGVELFPANDSMSAPPIASSDVSPLSSAKATPEIGAIESTGEHRCEIYGGIWTKEYGGDNKPIWFSTAPKVMNHHKAAAWAQGQGGSLPTRKQGDYLATLKGKGGAFTEIFNRGNSFPEGYVWLAEPNSVSSLDWCQRLSDGDQLNYDYRHYELPVLCVRR